MIDYDIDKYIIRKEQTLMEAMQIITKNQQGVGFVCEENRLQGALSDGDIRRKLIKTNNLESSAGSAANYNPHYVYYEDKDSAERMLYETDFSVIPIVDTKMHIIGVAVKEIHDVKVRTQIDLPVVIMAGGKGSRLKPYTDVLPKPLIPIGNKTILERIIDQFKHSGCKRFSLIINYKKELLKAYFSEIQHDYMLDFFEEEGFLGTAGGLKLLEDKVKDTFFVSNCDILVDCNYADLVRHHKIKRNIITIVCVRKKVTIPYGVLETDQSQEVIVDLKEKPSYDVLINTGVYVIEPDFLREIPSNMFIHITDVIKKCILRNKKVGIYCIDENKWLDMGQFNEMNRMKNELLP